MSIGRSGARVWRTTLGIILVAFPMAVQGQPQAVYEIPGISAWNTGKMYGFTFAPVAASGESVTRPLDGMNTRLTRTVTKLMLTQKVQVAQVVGGQPSVNQGERNTTFELFGGRNLNPGWIVKSVEVKGNFTYVEQPRLGTNDLSFKVRLAPGGTATVAKVEMHGPAGADWKDAFGPSSMKEYVINGTVAWNAAKKYGLTFTPLKDGSGYESSASIVGLPDGTFTALIVKPTGFVRCTAPPGGPSLTFQGCVLGQLAGGNMSVTMPFKDDGSNNTTVFEMFGTRKLSPRWTVKSVDVSNGTITLPASGDNLRFRVKLSSYGDKSAVAIVRSITLVGPSSAASIEDAFKSGAKY